MGEEKLGFPAFLSRELGSPPHGRGKDETFEVIPKDPGITPAWAGKSRRRLEADELPEDHPRVGGEKSLRWTIISALAGSPPRGRGKALQFLPQLLSLGITPAWAGKSFFCVDVHQIARDHPRVGGEKTFNAPTENGRKGSPPRGRGKGSKGWIV